jgi:quinoprotein glucose dehydrogenase
MKERLTFLSFIFLLIFSCNQPGLKVNTGWQSYGGDKGTTRYSPLAQVDTSNVRQLQIAWVYQSGDADTVHHSQIQCNPLIIDTFLYGTSPKMKLFALNAATGKELWVFDPYDSSTAQGGMNDLHFILNNCRGISYWTNGKSDRRIFYTVGSHVYAIDATTGKPIAGFGENGKIDLHEGLGRDIGDLFITATSPGMVYQDMLIMGSRVDEGALAAPGHIRAYDVRTGEQRWIFHTIPHPGEAGYETWEDTAAYKHIGGANNWSGMSLDEKRGILFVPTGSASWDFYGGKRLGDNLYADCLLALDAATGKRIWHFQQVHHDVWDRDLPTPPALVTVTRNGKEIDAVAQPSKTGFVFLFNRETGEPIFPIEEKPVPTDTELTNERLSPTQPIPVLPKPFVRQSFPESELNNLVPEEEYKDIKARWSSYRKDHMYAPPAKQGTIIFPGYDGGAEWGGPAFDPNTGLLYVNANEMAWVLTMVELKEQPRQKENWLAAGMRLYNKYCMSCHGANGEGAGNYPSLNDVQKKYNEQQFQELLVSGRRMMPAFQHMHQQERDALAAYVLDLRQHHNRAFVDTFTRVNDYTKMPYTTTGYNKFLTKSGYPAVRPPWGTLNAINLNTGEIEWKIPLGEYPEFKEKGIITGTENYGGPVVTAGGLVFIAATRDGKIRAFNKRTGDLLWEAILPAPGFATPSVYSVNGRQYIVIACGGGKLGTKSGDSYVAFALPENE